MAFWKTFKWNAALYRPSLGAAKFLMVALGGHGDMLRASSDAIHLAEARTAALGKRQTRKLDFNPPMKRLTERKKKWLLKRAEVEASKRRKIHARRMLRRKSVGPAFRRDGVKPLYVNAWWGDRQERLLSVGGKRSPPAVISFDANGDSTLTFLGNLRRTLAIRVDENISQGNRKWAHSPPGKGLRRISTYYDFSVIQRFETGPAVVLTAEYDRARRLMDQPPPTIDLHNWSDVAFKTLYELGFFEIVGLTSRTEERYRDLPDGDTRLMKMVSGSNADELKKTCESILELSSFIDSTAPLSGEIELSLNSAIGEAIVNVARHAYPDNFKSDYRQVKRWWISASANKATRSLSVVAYDQGASIPGTLPQRAWFHVVQEWVNLRRSILSRTADGYRDPDYIEYAMQFGNSSTGEIGRGQGLPQMRDFIDICGAGRLSILSRHGKCDYTPGSGFARSYLQQPIDGTLIEFEMTLPEPA